MNSEKGKEFFEMKRGFNVPVEIRENVFEIKAWNFIDSADNVNNSGAVLFNGEMIRAYTGIKKIKGEFMIMPVQEHVIQSWVQVFPQLIYDETEDEYCVYMYCNGIENMRICKGDVVGYAIKLN